MDCGAGRDFAHDGVEEAYELLVAVTLHASADDLAFQHIEGQQPLGNPTTDSYVGINPLAAEAVGRAAGDAGAVLEKGAGVGLFSQALR